MSASVPVFRIAAMDCAAEEGEIRHALAEIPEIKGLTFSLTDRTLAIDAPDRAVEQALAAIRAAGFEPVPVGPASADAPVDSTDAVAGSRAIRKMGFALALAVAAEAVVYFAPASLTFEAVSVFLAAIAIALAGFSTYAKGIAALRRGRLNINALMSVAVTGAFLIGQWPEAAMVMALYAIAELIEARAVDRARDAIKGLLDLTPATVEARTPDGAWRTSPVDVVAVGDIVRVKPGERVPLDGVVTAGTSSVDQAPVTGESMPVDKGVGDTVFAGTINGTGTLEFEVRAAAGDTTLARIIHAVEQAQGTRAPTQRFVDRFAAIYTPAVFAIAVAVAALTPWALGWAWTHALYKSLVLLVIACPCALVIATPVTVVSGLAAAARRGILIKGGVYLEDARKLRVIALDKTGTITSGQPSLVATEILESTVPPERSRRWAASLAAQSDHPVSVAIARGLKIEGLAVAGFTALRGRGVQGSIDGETLVLGNHRLIEERGQCSTDLELRLQAQERMGRTVTLLASSREVLAILAVADAVKPTSRDAVAALRRLGLVPVMLTGDNAETARAIGVQAGVEDARGNLLPEDKLAAVESLQRDLGPIAMAGDGINDAPALARADIGVAMGGAGTDIAMEAADVVIMNDDLGRIPELIQLSRNTHAILWQNISLALGIKVVFLALAVFGNATMWMAVFADMGASLLVVSNGMRLLVEEGEFDVRRQRWSSAG